MSQPLFGIVPAGLPVLTSPSETPSPGSFVYTIVSPPNAKPFSHVVVFLLPGVQLPPATAAAIYLVTPPVDSTQTVPSLRFLGGIGPGKESAIFKIAGTSTNTPTVLGISVEDAAGVAARIDDIRPEKLLPPPSAASSSTSSPPSTLLLAQRIGQNAFNFLASYSARIPGSSSSEEVIPMRAFEEWWRKFEGRVRSDPTFLERPMD
ncbi:duf775 domain containing protein [Grosmannia clavigera kw1407]|uniref:Duf775 domain containing protein n=1 Tax=Grosmannia clavigera (strain kw1407 / UAMH 11150) TaxID=655863 RepID=F0XFD6_GROCL|nr:duf775 domain containing protein [Grosmannia clavigera kw1407]EFX04288.1 duf775 domain containing protein [Grosmannia clavigera kw1407]